MPDLQEIQQVPPTQAEQGRTIQAERSVSAHVLDTLAVQHLPETADKGMTAVVQKVLSGTRGWGNEATLSGTFVTKVNPADRARSGTMNITWAAQRTDVDGNLIAASFRGEPVTFSRAELVAEACSELPKTPDGRIDESKLVGVIPNEAQRKLFIAFAEAQKSGQTTFAEVSDKKLFIEAARSMGYVTSDQLIALAQTKGIITAEDAKQLLDGPPPLPAPDADPAVPAPPKSPELTEKAKELQKAMGGEPILSKDQTRAALTSIGEIVDGKSARTILDSYDASITSIQEEILALDNAIPEEADNTKRAELKKRKLGAEKKLQEVVNEARPIDELLKQLKTETGSQDFDLLTPLYDTIEGGEGSQEATMNFLTRTAPITPGELYESDSGLADAKTATAKKARSDAKKAMWGKIVKYGGIGTAGITALFVWKAMRKRDEGGPAG